MIVAFEEIYSLPVTWKQTCFLRFKFKITQISFSFDGGQLVLDGKNLLWYDLRLDSIENPISGNDFKPDCNQIQVSYSKNVGKIWIEIFDTRMPDISCLKLTEF